MGALLSGLLGAAGADIEKQSDRAYQEKRQERMDRMNILQLALSNPNLKPEQIAPIMNDLQDVADDAKYKSENKGVKDPFRQMIKPLTYIFGRHKQQQQQAGQRDQARADVQGAPGVTAQPAGQQMPPMSGATQRVGQLIRPEMMYTQADIDARKIAEEKRAEETEGRKEERKRTGALDTFTKEQTLKESLDVGTESRHYRQIQDRVAQLKKNPDTKDMPIEDLYAIAAGKAPTSGGKTMKGDIMPDAESSTGFSRIMMNHRGDIVGRESGILPPAGWAPSSATTYRFVPQPDGTFKAVQVTSTHARQIPGMPPTRARQVPGGGVTTGGAPSGPAGAVTPPPPTSQQPSAAGGFANVARPGAVVGQKPPGEGEMAIAHGAQGAMDSAVRMSRELRDLPRKHPNLVGQSMGRIASLGGRLNMIPGDMRQMLADKDSIAAFTMGVHRARGRGYADKWAEAIGDPFVNPEATSAVVQRIAKIAEAVQKRILSQNRFKPTSVEEIERQMDKEGAFSAFDQPPPTGAGGPPRTRLNPYR